MEPFTPEFEDRVLPCILDTSEKLEFGKRLASTLAEKAELEDEKKTVVASYKVKIDTKENEIYRLRRCVETGIERRNVRCQVIVEPYRMKVRIVREDTGELVEERNATKQELQPYLPMRADNVVSAVKEGLNESEEFAAMGGEVIGS